MPTVTKSIRKPPSKKRIKGKTVRHKPRGIDIAWSQFQADLEELLKTHAGAWVTYEGCTRVEFGTDRADLILRCLNRGLRPDEFLVCRVEAAGGEFTPT